MDLATARQIHGSLIHVCAPPSEGGAGRDGGICCFVCVCVCVCAWLPSASPLRGSALCLRVGLGSSRSRVRYRKS
eukprot:496681-Pyramimonas_sp.AAC.1